jgi:hypothetical protein
MLRWLNASRRSRWRVADIERAGPGVSLIGRVAVSVLALSVATACRSSYAPAEDQSRVATELVLATGGTADGDVALARMPMDASEPSPPSGDGSTSDALAPQAAGLSLPSKKHRGSRCAPRKRGECPPGLACCETGRFGDCGDMEPHALVAQLLGPCEVITTCAQSPCKPMSYPK